MAATKSRTSIWAAQNLAASGANVTSGVQNLSTTYGSQLNVRLTNGATGPTTGAQVQIQVANDSTGTLWTDFGGALQGGTGNSEVDYWSVEIPIGVAGVQLIAVCPTGQAVTVDADISNVTGV